ncbi:uncharacterized protein [Nicotiana tomentosiformis]|uniref:uncharacterized protein n=1 Tax=Nicotiana tomentosiformis TaxID=4098 RepID=UPI00388CC167
MFLREYVPQSLGYAWRAEFEQLRQGSMTVSEYAFHFSGLARHAPALVATVRERVPRFIERLHPSIRTSMARELEMDITYQQAMCIARRVEGMFARDREEREAKRSRETGHYSGACAPVARYGRGFVSHPVHSALPAASGFAATMYVDKEYSIAAYLNTYSGQLQPVGAEHYWPPEPFKMVCNREYVRQRQVQKRTHIRNQMDVGNTVYARKCGICSQTGHDRRKCPSAGLGSGGNSSPVGSSSNVPI